MKKSLISVSIILIATLFISLNVYSAAANAYTPDKVTCVSCGAEYTGPSVNHDSIEDCGMCLNCHAKLDDLYEMLYQNN